MDLSFFFQACKLHVKWAFRYGVLFFLFCDVLMYYKNSKLVALVCGFFRVHQLEYFDPKSSDIKCYKAKEAMSQVKFFRVTEAVADDGRAAQGASTKVIGVDGKGRIVSENTIGSSDNGSAAGASSSLNMSFGGRDVIKKSEISISVPSGAPAAGEPVKNSWYANEYVASVVIFFSILFELALCFFFVERFSAWIIDRSFSSNANWFDYACYFVFFAQMMLSTFIVAMSATTTLLYSWGIDMVDYENSIMMPDHTNVSGVMKWIIRCNVQAFRYLFIFIVFAGLTLMFLIFLSAAINKPLSLNVAAESSLLNPYLAYMSETWGGLPSFFSLSAIPIASPPGTSVTGGLAGVPPTSPIATVQGTPIQYANHNNNNAYASFQQPRYNARPGPL